jgi:arabinogalactan endo-1,4-beta-galactosidase
LVLTDSVYEYTRRVLAAFKAQGTLPEMIQTGNEINHGMLWPDGNIQHPGSLAILLKAAIAAVRDVDPKIIVMLHIALGGQNSESQYFLDNMISNGVTFDVIGESYYPKWHGTLQDLENNLASLEEKYHKPVIVAEYSLFKEEVNTIAFGLRGDQLKGSFIWEPLNTWEYVINKDGKTNELITKFDAISQAYQFPK